MDSIPKPRLEQSLPAGVRPEELRVICDAMKRGYRRGRRKGWTRPGQLLWRIPAFWTSLLTGLRRSEIARLRWLVDLDFHALRKGFCSELARKGTSATTIKHLARHKSIETSRRYIEPDDSAFRRALDSLF